MSEEDVWADFRKEVERALEKAAKEIVDAVLASYLLSEKSPIPKSRAVSVKAKNLEAGVLFDWPGWEDRSPINNVTVEHDRVLVIGAGQRFAVFDTEERVRVYRG